MAVTLVQGYVCGVATTVITFLIIRSYLGRTTFRLFREKI